MTTTSTQAALERAARWIFAMCVTGMLGLMLASASISAAVLDATGADPSGVAAALLTLAGTCGVATLLLARRTRTLMEAHKAAVAKVEKPTPPQEPQPRLFVVALTYAAARHYARQAGWNPSRTVALSTSDPVSLTRARGYLIQDRDELVYLDGWEQGPHADDVSDQLAMCDRRTEPAP